MASRSRPPLMRHAPRATSASTWPGSSSSACPYAASASACLPALACATPLRTASAAQSRFCSRRHDSKARRPPSAAPVACVRVGGSARADACCGMSSAARSASRGRGGSSSTLSLRVSQQAPRPSRKRGDGADPVEEPPGGAAEQPSRGRSPDASQSPARIEMQILTPPPSDPPPPPPLSPPPRPAPPPSAPPSTMLPSCTESATAVTVASAGARRLITSSNAGAPPRVGERGSSRPAGSACEACRNASVDGLSLRAPDRSCPATGSTPGGQAVVSRTRAPERQCATMTPRTSAWRQRPAGHATAAAASLPPFGPASPAARRK
mmetsp:Transcript_33841/g.112908  ORF Transcript_33841/g.112908 Transcript_33841/m.112908 type:complete len:323 (-) Transcript_33841:205-1173(-)